MSSSADRARRRRRRLAIAAVATAAAIAGFVPLPTQLQASLREIGAWTLLGIPLLIIGGIWLLSPGLLANLFPFLADDGPHRGDPVRERVLAEWRRWPGHRADPSPDDIAAFHAWLLANRPQALDLVYRQLDRADLERLLS